MMLMLIGAGGNLWAAEKTETFVAGINTGETSVTSGPITVSMSTMSRTDNYRAYAGSQMTVSSSNGNITKIEVACTASGTSNYGPGKFSGEGYSYSGKVGTWTGSAKSVSLSASAQVRITQIVVTYLAPDGVVDPAVSFESNSLSLEVGETAENAISKPSDLNVTYASGNQSVATVDANGVVTGVGVGETTITASWTAVANTYNAGSESYTVNVTAATPSTTYVKVTNVNQLVAGNKYILVATGYNAAMGARNGNFRDGISIVIVDDVVKVKENSGVVVITLEGSKSGGWSLKTSDANQYLMMSSDATDLKEGNSNTSDGAKWVLTDDLYLHNKSFTTRFIGFNSEFNRFGSYKSENVSLFVEKDSPIDNKQDVSLTFPQDIYEATMGTPFTAPTLTVNPSDATSAVAYTSSDGSVATVGADGTVTIVGAGTTTITASISESETYKDATASYTLKVIDPNAPGTQNNPYTVALALEFIETLGTSTSDEVYVTGVITKVEKFYSNYNSIDYYISDKNVENELLVYSGKGIQGADFSAITDLQVSDEVVVKGKLKNYNGTPEFDKTSSIVTLVHKEKTEAGLVFSPETATAERGQLFTAPQLTNPNNLTVAYSSSNEAVATVDSETGSVTLLKAGETTITATFDGDSDYKSGSASYTLTVTVPSHTATFFVNGQQTGEGLSVAEDAVITFPEVDQEILDKKFVGWTTTPITGSTDEKPATLVTSAIMEKADVIFYAVYANVTPGTATSVTDVLNRETTGVTGTSYTGWSGKTVTSNAVYAGQSAGGNESIQLRSDNSNSGVITTASGGRAKKVVVTWNSKTTSGRTLNVYGSNTAYSAASDLYGDNAGTLLGTIVYESRGTELTVDGDYQYIGLRSANGAMYLTSVSIDWENGTPDTYSAYSTNLKPAAPTFSPEPNVAEKIFDSQEVTITCETEGAEIYYQLDDSEDAVKYEAPFTLTETTTVRAWAQIGEMKSDEVEANYIIVPAVAQIEGGAKYETLDAAIEAATAGQTITLLDNIDLGNAYANINKAITINGDGHTITSSASAAVEVSGTGDVTISNTKIEATAGRGVQIGNLAHYSGKLTINEGSEITVAKRGINILDVDEGFELNVVNSIIQTNVEDPTTTYTTGEDSRGINFSNDPLAYNANITNTVIRGFSYDVNVYRGTENLTLTMVGGKSYGRDIINNWGKNNTFTLNGVEIHGLNNQTGPTEGFACVVDNEGSEHNTYVINNCQFIAVLSEAAMGEEGSSASEYMFALRGTDATVKVTGETTYTTNAPERGGFIESESQLAGNTVYFDETAKGQFENSFVDYKVVATETAPGFIVAAKEYVAQVGDVKYETFTDAVTAAENNTITLLANIADTYTLAEAQSLNVNLNGHTINVVAPEGYILQTSEADGVTTYSYVAPVAKIGETQFASLQAAVDAAQQLGGAQTINLLDNISGETVTIKEVANFQLTIDGKKDAESNYTVDAVIVVDGLRGNGGSTTNGASVTLQNIAFVKTTSTDGIQATHYPHHLTIQDCTYSGSDNDKWFLNASVDGPLYGVTVKNVTVEHARLIYANMADDAVFQNITATNDVKVGFNVKTSGTALIENCQVTTGKYAFRDYSDGYAGTFTLKDNTFISTSEESDEGVIVNRGGTVGTTHINVESGTYSGHIKVLNNKEGVLAISGGIYNESVAEEFCAEGYICVANPDTETSEAYPYAVAPRPYVAQIGETQYYSLADAIAAVPADGTETTITMIDNEMVNVVGYAITIPSTKNVVIDLNGFQVVGTAGEAGTSALIRNLGTLTIKDSSDTKKDGTGTGKLISGASPTWTWDGTDDYSGSYASNLIRNEKDLIVESGLLYTMSKGSAAYAIDNYSAGNITINGGKVDAAKASAVRMFYVNGGSITVNDGIVGHYNSEEDYSYMGVQVMSGTNVNVSVAGGTIAGFYALYANNTGGSLAISGGTFDGYVGIAAAVPNDILSISGGTFNEWVGTWGDQTKFISGGTYSMKPDAEYIADGYIAAQQGNVYVVIPESDMPSAPTIFHDEGTYEGTLDVAIAGQGTIMYKLGDSEAQAYSAPFEISETTKVTAWAEQDGIKSAEVSKTFTIVEAQKGPSVTDGYYNIMTNDGKYVNVAGRKTVTLVDDNEGMPGTVIRVKATDGKVETLRSQGVDVPSYAQKAMNYVPEIVQLAVDKLGAEGAGNLLGEHGLEALKQKFDESFDYNLYLEGENNIYRIYGKTPSMKPVVDFYAENKDNVDAKLPQLEAFINSAIDKVLDKTGGRGASILVDFDLETVWQNMGGTLTKLTKPVDEASTAKFYEEVLTSEANVWNFAYQTAMIYWGNLKNNETFKNNLDKLGDYAKYIDKVENIQPNFKYYIVPSESGVDFISEGNIAITDNDPSVAWTMGECTEFKVNFDVELNHTVYSTNGGVQDEYKEYYTTLYTDFAYTVPEGVKAYKVTEITEKFGVAVREEIEGTIPAQTPVMLVSSNEGAQALTLSTEDGAAVTGNLLVGADELINQYQLKTSQVESLFNLAKDVIGESAYNEYLSKYEHLMLTNAGTVNNKYFFGLSAEDIEKCVVKNEINEDDCVIRNLSTGEEKIGFYNNWTAGANQAFLISSLNPVKLWLVGDVNRDGSISIADVTALVNIILGKAIYPEDADEYDFEAANVNGDNIISISDVTKLVNMILGKE